MWNTVKSKKSILKKAIEITSDVNLFGYWMREVVKSWPITCEHNLTDTGSNRRAFIGQAALTKAIGCPEDITRLAWGMLPVEKKELANLEADKVILSWEKQYNEKKNRPLLEQMEEARLSKRSTSKSKPKIRNDEQSSLLSSRLQSHY